MIPRDIRLYTWLDAEDVLFRALENGKRPDWFVDARAYWDGITIRVSDGNAVEADAWVRSIFEPRILPSSADLFSVLELALESTQENARSLPILIEETSDPASTSKLKGSFARPSLVTPGFSEPLRPTSLPADSPTIFAFHSFKGGAGRTLHAVALSQALSEAGHKVLLVDADLEAPGISWLLEGRLPNPPVAVADLLALVHGDPEPTAHDAVALVASRLKDALLNKICVLPSFRTPRMFHALDIRPEHLLQGRTNPLFLTEIFASLGRELGVGVIVIDLRAGLSELSAGLLLDPRVNRIFLTSLSGQALKGTEMVLRIIASRAPSDIESHPVPMVILNQIPQDLRGSAMLTNAEERLLESVSRAVNKLDLDAAQVLIGPTWFDNTLLTLPASWDETLTTISRSQLRETVRVIVDSVPPATPPSSLLPIPDLDEERRTLSQTANKLVFAEKGEGDDFLPISPLRHLAENHRSQLPVAAIVGAKGAGKTFTFLQIVRHQSWRKFAAAVGDETGTIDAVICPVLQSANVSGKALPLLKTAREFAQRAADGKDALIASDIQDRIRDWLQMGLHEGQWRDNWLDLMAWSIGFETGRNGAGRRLSKHLVARGQRILFAFDGLEDTFRDLSSNVSEQKALRALLQDVPTYLAQEPDRMVGTLIFVRRDMVVASVVQNSAHLLSSYESYALKWDRVEALRLVAWVALKSGILPHLTPENIREWDEEKLTESLIKLWGRKLGSDKSREGRSADWVIAALSDFKGQVQARDLVRFLKLAAQKSNGNAQWPDRVLVPSAIRDTVADCSTEKIEEISQENVGLKSVFEKLAALQPAQKNIPFQREDLSLTQDEVQLLDLNGIVVYEDSAYYMAEIFRRGLGFSLSSGVRPKVLALARKRSAI